MHVVALGRTVQPGVIMLGIASLAQLLHRFEAARRDAVQDLQRSGSGGKPGGGGRDRARILTGR